MAKLFDFTRSDNHFVESALDPAKRIAAIRQLTRNRQLYFGIMILMLVIWLASFIFFPGDTLDLGSLTLFVMWAMVYIPVDNQIKMLKTFERMESLPKADGE